ncbi:MAG: hypothetical protein RMM31_11195 [Anaerolineae bacterium]|nr:hypothetical protein [Anaerolineae bacterium]
MPSLYLEIALDAVVLFDPQGYLQLRLARLQQAIARLGLRRERVGRDTTWSWQQPPAAWSLSWEEGL